MFWNKYYSKESSERLLSEDDYNSSNTNNSSNLRVQFESIKFQINNLKEENIHRKTFYSIL